MPFKNTTVTYNYVAWDTANNVGKTGDGGNHTISGSRDGTQFTPADTTPAEVDSTNLQGVYSLDLSAAENNGTFLTMGGESSTASIVIIPISWSNEINGNLTYIMDTILTEGGSGRLAAALIKLLDVATPALVASDVMRGTDSAPTKTQMDIAHALLATPAQITAAHATTNALIVALAAVVGALDDAAAEGDVTDTDTLMQYIKQIVNAIGSSGMTFAGLRT